MCEFVLLFNLIGFLAGFVYVMMIVSAIVVFVVVCCMCSFVISVFACSSFVLDV